ncbi:MAG: LacI family transcriptional regulator, partial [Actinobacteria bacterium]|nr:LacI family transcriptional regulator [Actinomycetota bacterium]
MKDKDIAKLAGVSRSTVSRVVNDYDNVAPKTKEKIKKVIKKYGYVPHASARALAGKSNKIIGVFVTNAIQNNKGFRIFRNIYFSPFEAAVIDYAGEEGYNVLISIINNDSDFEKARELFYNKTISGGIFVGARNSDRKIFKLIESGYKMVIIDQEQDKAKMIGKYIVVNSDNLDGAYKATKHLIEYGHKEIAHICGDMNKFSGFRRLEGYKKAMSEAGLPVKEGNIVKGDFTEDSGYSCVVRQLIEGNNITGIFASNDVMAVGAMKAIKEMGLKIPDDISIVGYDDITIASYTSPPLATVKISISKMASIAAKSLINFIENGINYSEYNTVSA